MPPPLEEWGGLDYFIGANGVCVYDARTRACLREGAIAQEDALETMELTADLDAAWLAFYDDIVMREMRSHYYLALEMKRTGIPDARAYGFFSADELRDVYHVESTSANIFELPMVDDLAPFIRQHAGAIHKLAATFPSRAAAEEAFSRLQGVSSIEAAHTAGVEIEISAAGYTKGTSSAWLAHHLGIPRERTVAFGDAGNDTPFIRPAAIGVALGNAKDDVAEQADIVAPTCLDDGMAAVLEELGIARV